MIENSATAPGRSGFGTAGSSRPPSASRTPDSGKGSSSAPYTDSVRVWAAYGVSVAAVLHLAAGALVLINRSH